MPHSSQKNPTRPACETLEPRQLLSWASYATLVGQDKAASDFSSIKGDGVTVAMIDTGIDYNLPQLGGGFGAGHKVIAGYDFYSNDSDPMDESGHGTETASVVAASSYTVNGITYQGVAPDAKLVALRVGTDSDISFDNIKRALDWIIANYQKYSIDVVNMSIGSGNYTDPHTDSLLSGDFQTLKNDGIFVVAASGNSQDQVSGPISQDGIAYPAADPNVFAVGAVDSSDVITTWAQRGDELDLLAPGVQIEMPKLGGGFEAADGTSFASPYVAGTAALIKQKDPTARPGDIGSILMTSGVDNRDGDNESGNTTGLEFSRLDIDNALKLTAQRVGNVSSMDFGTNFDTALDSQGVLHAAWYQGGKLEYATRDVDGLWSSAQIVDQSDDTGAMPTIAVDTSGKVGIGYFDLSNTAVKYAFYNGTKWTSTTVESDKHVGWYPSLQFDINGNAYLAYYKRSGGLLRMATLNRDANTWSRRTIDGGGGDNVGITNSLDLGEAALVGNFGFTVYHTTVAIAYSDTTNGELKYARLDLDDPTATWFTSVVDKTGAIGAVSLDLHDGPLDLGLQAQIVYQDASGADVKYAYRNTDWFTESVATTGKLGDFVGLYFDSNEEPIAVYYDRLKKTINVGQRTGTNTGTWTLKHLTTGSGPLQVAFNQRTSQGDLSWLNRPKDSVLTSMLI